jgi:hypothetical protein
VHRSKKAMWIYLTRFTLRSQFPRTAMSSYTFMIVGTVMMDHLESMTSDELFELHEKN